MRLVEIVAALRNNGEYFNNALLFAPARNIQTWDRIRKDPFYREQLAELRQEAREFLEKPISVLSYSTFKLFWETGSRKEYETLYFEHRAQLNDFAILSLLDEEPAYIWALEDTIWAICDEYTWCLPAHLHDSGARRDSQEPLEYKERGVLTKKQRLPEKMLDLFATETAFALAEILSLLEPKLSAEVIQRGRAEIFRRILEPYQELNPISWWETATMNWAAVCAGSIGAAALYLIDDPDVLAPLLNRVVGTLECFISGFGEDGACLEGISYWTYGFGFYLYFAALLHERTGGSLDLLGSEKIARIALFQQQCYLSENYVVSFSDTDITQNYHPGLTFYLKKRFPQVKIPDPRYQAKFSEDETRRWAHAIRDLVWTGLEAECGLEKETAVHFPEAQWFIGKREYKGLPVCFAAKGGHNDEPHNHNDLGSFIFHAGGDIFLADLGRSEYTRQYFNDSERYQFLTTSSRGHSVPVIDGAFQKNGPEYRAGNFTVESNEQRAVVQFEFSQAYAIPHLTSLKRNFTIAKTGLPKVLLTDHYNFVSTPRSVTERLISYYPPESIHPGRLRLSGKKMNLDIVFAPEQFHTRIHPEEFTTPDAETAKIYMIDLEIIQLSSQMIACIAFEITE